MSRDLLATARRLARTNTGKPRQSDLRRSISTAHYALFHALAKDAADFFAGANSSESSWAHVYRALDHGHAKNVCQQINSPPFPPTIENFAVAFLELQRARHNADYNPLFRINRADALSWCDRTEQALNDLQATPRPDRRSFIVQLLIRKR